MSLSDHVARYIHTSQKEAAKRFTNLTVREIHDHTKHSVAHEHPRTGTLLVSYRLKVGDVLQPKHEALYGSPFHNIIVTPLSKLVVYRTSWLNENEYYPEFPSDNREGRELKTTILHYEHHDLNIDLGDISGVMCLIHHFSVVQILEFSTYLGNIADRLD